MGFFWVIFWVTRRIATFWRSTFSTFERERYLQFLEIEITNSFANWGNYFGLVSGILEVWCSGSKYSSNMRSIFMTAIVGKKKRLQDSSKSHSLQYRSTR